MGVTRRARALVATAGLALVVTACSGGGGDTSEVVDIAVNPWVGYEANAGVVGYYLQNMLNCSDEHFEFHKWYLREKGYIVVTEHGTLAITIHGVDHVIAMSRSTRAEKLLIAQSRKAED